MHSVGFQRHIKSPSKFAWSCLISCTFVFLTQFALTLIPRYLASSPLLLQLPLSAILLLAITGLGNGCRRLLRFYASAPAFVFLNVFFIWGVHVTVIGKGIPMVWIVVFNVGCVLLIFGLYRILSGDPGLISYRDASSKELIQNEDSGVESYSKEEGLSKLETCLEEHAVKMEECSAENSLPLKRIRYCKYCKAYIKGLDHHCPAFGNCIGEKNHLLFMALLVGFILVETSYIVCSSTFITKSMVLDKAMLEFSLCGYLAISTRLFSILQVLWQVLFLTWHIYCVCVNIKTDEWINWKKYPEFQNFVHLQPGESNLEPRFQNPYNRGVLDNIKEFLSPKK